MRNPPPPPKKKKKRFWISSKLLATPSNSEFQKQLVLLIGMDIQGRLTLRTMTQQGDKEEGRHPVVSKPWDLKGRRSWSSLPYVTAKCPLIFTGHSEGQQFIVIYLMDEDD